MAYDDIVTNLNLEKLQAMYAVNVFTPMMITKYALRNMLLHHTKGCIIHISSISAHTGYKGLAMYASSKGALEAFLRIRPVNGVVLVSVAMLWYRVSWRRL